MLSTCAPYSLSGPAKLLAPAVMALALSTTAFSQTITTGAASFSAISPQDQHLASATRSASATVSRSKPQGARRKGSTARLFHPDLAAIADPYALDHLSAERPPAFDSEHPSLKAPGDSSGILSGSAGRLVSPVPRDPWLPKDSDPDIARAAPWP